MSKKIIAVAAAAALALAGLVAPANAAGSSLTVVPTIIVAPAAGSQPVPTGTGLTSTAAFEIAVPSQDVLRLTSTASRVTVLALEVSTRSDNAAVSVSSTGTVKLINASQLAASTTTSATGTQTLSLTANDTGKATFYAYSTSTSAGSITVTEAGATPASNTVWVKGVTAAANAYKLTVVAPTISGLGSKVEYTATVVDMFGNALDTPVINGQTLGGDATPGGPTAMVYSSTKKIYEGSFTNRTTAGATALLVSLAASADAVTAFGAKTTSVFVNVAGQDLQAAITGLQAQVAALTADYNALAAKWNKKHKKKKNKVALK